MIVQRKVKVMWVMTMSQDEPMPLVKPKLLDITDIQDLKSYWKKGKKFLHAKVNAYYKFYKCTKRLKPDMYMYILQSYVWLSLKQAINFLMCNAISTCTSAKCQT